MTTPMFTIDDVISPHLLAYAKSYERDIYTDMELRRKQMLCAVFEPVEYATGTGIYLRVVSGGRS